MVVIPLHTVERKFPMKWERVLKSWTCKTRLLCLVMAWSSFISTYAPTPRQNTFIPCFCKLLACMTVLFMSYDLPSVTSIKILSASLLPPVLKLLVAAYASAVVIWVPPGWYGILSMAVIKDATVWWSPKANWWLTVVAKVSIPTLVLLGPMSNIEINDFIAFSVILKFESPTDPDVSSKKTTSLGAVLQSVRIIRKN